MADAYLVDVNLERLRLHRSEIEQRELSDEDIRLWLVRYGFYPRIDGLYLAEGAVLQQLEPGEIRAVQAVRTRPQ